MKFDIEAVCNIIRVHEFKIVTLQFPDEFLPISVEIYNQLSSQLNEDVSLFIAADSTYGSSLDDVSALHVESDALVYFGSDLSSGSGSVPVIVAPEIKEIKIEECIEQICNAIATSINMKVSDGKSPISSASGCIPLLLSYEGSYQYSIASLRTTLENHLLRRSIEATINIATLPSHLDLHNWKHKSTFSSCNNTNTNSSGGSSVSNVDLVTSTTTTMVGGLLVDTSVALNPNTVIIYIGDKLEQLTAILLHLSQNQVIAYSPADNTQRVMQGSSSREFQQRSGGMLRVKEAQTIGIIVGSMGLTADLTQAALHRLQLLIQESGRRHFTFAMGRLNEAKLSNFPEIDLFCLISNDDSSLIPAK